MFTRTQLLGSVPPPLLSVLFYKQKKYPNAPPKQGFDFGNGLVGAVHGDVPGFSEAGAGVGDSARANRSSPILKGTAPQT